MTSLARPESGSDYDEMSSDGSGSYDAFSSGGSAAGGDVGGDGGSPGAGAGGAASVGAGEALLASLSLEMGRLAGPVGFFPSGYAEQFERVQRETEPDPPSMARQSSATHKKNRYFDILPLEATRVTLKPRTEESGTTAAEGSDYINANFIDDPVSGRERAYIAAQAPLPDHLSDWWQMIWDEGVRVIFMLTSCREGATVKAHPYWPSAVGPGSAVQANEGLSVVLEEEEASSPCVGCVRRVLVLQTGDGGRRRVHMIQHVDWPDRRALGAESFDQLKRALVVARDLAGWNGDEGGGRNTRDDDGGSIDSGVVKGGEEGKDEGIGGAGGGLGVGGTINGDASRGSVRGGVGGAGGVRLSPMLVHCSAGVGRTGSVIAADVITGALAAQLGSFAAADDSPAVDGAVGGGAVGGAVEGGAAGVDVDGGGRSGGEPAAQLLESKAAGIEASVTDVVPSDGGQVRLRGVVANPVDVYAITKALRMQRTGMVMTQVRTTFEHQEHGHVHSFCHWSRCSALACPCRTVHSLLCAYGCMSVQDVY